MFTYLGISASIDHVPVYVYMHKHVKGVRYRTEVFFGTQISAAREHPVVAIIKLNVQLKEHFKSRILDLF